MLFDEYYKLPEQTAESFKDGFFSAGDMARQDEDGFYYLVDRKKNMIITGGENVYPSEVEEVVGNIEGVFDCAVVGLSDEKWGERVAAVIIRKPGFDDSNLNEQNVIQGCKGKMAGYKCPKQVIFIGENDMPRTGTGKILHRILREQFG
jgi:acyl-CoA synthetase (AMP-forming)/AMP-acid ligase II